MACLFSIISLILIIIFILKKKFWSAKQKSLLNKHVIITGGSSGIGKSVAIDVARRGAHVTIIARDLHKLQDAHNDILKARSDPSKQKINYYSADVTNVEQVESVINNAEKEAGSIYMLVNCAGMAICGKLENMSTSNINYLINLNLLGTIFPTRHVISNMKNKKEGIIVITASQAALLGIFGYSIYNSTKFALRGFAEAIHMECKLYNVSVTLSLPPDTDTPGFANEEKSKPIETKLISEGGGLVSPEKVAKQLVIDALDGKFFSYVGFESFILTTLSSAMSPLSSFSELFIQSCLMGPLRIVAAIILQSFYKIIRTCNKDKNL